MPLDRSGIGAGCGGRQPGRGDGPEETVRARIEPLCTRPELSRIAIPPSAPIASPGHDEGDELTAVADLAEQRHDQHRGADGEQGAADDQQHHRRTRREPG